MNLATIDIEKIENPFIGKEVVIFSSNPTDLNSIQNSAQLSQTIPYDLLVHISDTIKRVID
jgi:alanine racemase